ncbi:hypothetical protein [Marinifilum breve]|nr:hypothetical protein [Marinifilum breve]
MSVFKIDEVRKYVEIKEEATQLKVDNLLKNDERVKEALEKAVQNHLEAGKQLYMETKGKEHLELFHFVVTFLNQQTKEKRKIFLEQWFEQNREHIEPHLNND